MYASTASISPRYNCDSFRMKSFQSSSPQLKLDILSLISNRRIFNGSQMSLLSFIINLRINS